jgi:capsular polysaccharide biosynthesis protein
LFRNLTKRHLLNIFFYGLLGITRNIFKIKIDNSTDKLLVFNIWGNGYHHFIMEVLLKLILYKNNIANYSILIPKNSPPFIMEALKHIGIKNYTILNNPTIFKNLTIIENPDSGEYSKEHLVCFRNFLIPQTNNTQNFKIYISRKKARARKIKNEEELEQYLINIGFLILNTEDKTFMDQVEIFSNSNYLVSIHGAGLTNMVFMKSNSKIVEFYPEFSANDLYKENLCYKNLANSLDFNYNKIICKRENKMEQFDIADISIDLELIKKIIN